MQTLVLFGMKFRVKAWVATFQEKREALESLHASSAEGFRTENCEDDPCLAPSAVSITVACIMFYCQFSTFEQNISKNITIDTINNVNLHEMPQTKFI